MESQKRIVIIGGGAAGIFAAVLCAEKNPNASVLVLEKTRQLLSKVRISGGGRCNVTHSQFDPKALTQFYPRGNKELLGPFHRFQPKDTIAWFEEKGVALKTEEDGRIFPTTDQSQTIIDCLLNTARTLGVTIRSEASVASITKTDSTFTITLNNDETIACDALILATGSSPQGHALSSAFGHTIVPPVPSLFTFNVPTSPLLDLSGIAVKDVQLKLSFPTPKTAFEQRGILLLTHFGFSGPCALKLSAWAARPLHACNYRTTLFINWIPHITAAQALAHLTSLKNEHTKKTLEKHNPFQLPSQLWKRLLQLCDIAEATSIGHLRNDQLRRLVERLTEDAYPVEGKTLNKQEFVTCGGVSLKEIDFKTMQSRLVDNLYFAGEILDIDGVTGGFNFQNAWTTAFLAASAIS